MTRAGVYKRLAAGKLSAFCFHIIGKKKTFFGGVKKLKEFPVVYIPVSECKAWNKELDRRVKRLEKLRKIAEEDEAALDEADPTIDDPSPDFLHYDPKDKNAVVPWKMMNRDNDTPNPDLPDTPERKDNEEEPEDEDRER